MQVRSTAFNGRSLWLAVILAAAIVPASAQQGAVLQSYDVELVIFRNLSDKATAEEWSLEAAAAGQRLSIPDDEAVPVEPPPETAATTSFPALPAAKYKLTPIEESLRRSRNFQPLAHFGWTQPGYPRDDARFLAIQPLVPGSSGLKGQIALSRGRYLHLTLDLVYAGADGQRYVLRQARRMRSNERHYIDHPRFGVIALVTPTT
jgi:Peptidoglycan-binding protein, CsiV